jgi:hypothetical protein
MKKSAQELLKECIDRGIECAMETPAEDCRVPFDIATEIQFDIWDEIRSAFYFEYGSAIKRKTHEEMLMDISDWVNADDSDTHVAPEMKPWAWLNDKEIDEIKQTAPAYVSAKAVNTVVDMVEEKLNQKYEWGDDDGNTGVAFRDDGNTHVAPDDHRDMIECGTCGYPLLPEERRSLVESNGKMVKPWVGLTKKEFQEAVDDLFDLEDCWVAIEAALKEKNKR